jgi:hypothetical protein
MGRLSLGMQLGIILAAFGICFFLLLAFLGYIGQPPKPIIVDQKLIDQQWLP